MNCKTFEIRDRATFIPAIGIQLQPACEKDRWLLSKSGFGKDISSQEKYIILIRLYDAEAQYTPSDWSNTRTMSYAHKYIIENWDSLDTGAVIDVEFILGETESPKISEYE